MELFYSGNIRNGVCVLDEDEGRHCIKVLRHSPGDIINVIDGKGSLYECRITGGKKEVVCDVLGVEKNFGAHNYRLTTAVSPTKNIDRYEWFLEKATEIGVDEIVPVIAERSERRIIKRERLEKILLSASKQSIKGAIPVLAPQADFCDFIKRFAGISSGCLKLIAYCGDGEKRSLPEAVNAYLNDPERKKEGVVPEITVLIGPEGDFSEDEVKLALSCGFEPVHLGESRLRTETAAIAAVSCIYFMLS